MPLTPSSRAPGLHVGDAVEIDPSAELGANVVLHDGTRIGPGCVVEDGAVIGKQVRFAARSRASREPAPPALLEAGAVVCAGALVYAGARIGRDAIVGDQATVRERAFLGEQSVLGRGAAIGADTRIGARVRIQNLSGLVSGMVVEDDVFVGPMVMTTNDASMGEPGQPLMAPVIRRGCRIGAGAILFPGVEIGAGAVVGAGALVTRDVPAGTLVTGSPARVVRGAAG